MRTRRKTSDHSSAGTGRTSPTHYVDPFTDEDREHHREVVELIYLTGGTTGQIVSLAAQQLNAELEKAVDAGMLTPAQAERRRLKPQRLLPVLSAIRQANRDDYEARKETRKTDQLARLHYTLGLMHTQAKRPFSSITALEKLASEIEGNLAPRRIQVDVHAVPDALAQSCASMTESDVERIIAEELELRKKLAAINTTATPVLETTASEVP